MRTLNIRWVPTKWDKSVDSICQSWARTPWRHNRKTKNVGVDCLHFAASVLDELYGTENSKKLSSLPPDACVHNKKGVMSAARALFSTYPNIKRVHPDTIEAGDLIICGKAAELDSTQHLMIASSNQKIWHASYPFVHETGPTIPKTMKLVAIYRSQDKYRWRMV